MRMKATLVVALIFFYNAGSALATDYIIVDQPQQLKILNHYEQNLSSSAVYALPSSIPFKIVQEDVMLSDQFTRAIQVNFAGKDFFLVKDGTGRLINQSPETEYRYFRNVSEFHDPVRVSSGRRIGVQIPGSDSKDSIIMTEGSDMYPVFSTGSRIYINISEGRAQYGWVDKDATGKWQKADQEQEPSASQPELNIKTHIGALTEHINALYARIFSDLSDVSGRRYPAPGWRIEESTGSIRLIFSPAEYGEQFRESIALMITEIEILLRNTSWMVARTRDPLVFDIHEKENN